MPGSALEIVGRVDVPGAPFFLVHWTGFARGGLHVVDCDAWKNWNIGFYWLWIRSGLDPGSHSSRVLRI